MTIMADSTTPTAFGSGDLRLPEALRGPLKQHLAELHQKYVARGWAGRVGFGQRPAVIVIDLAEYWTNSRQQIGTNLDPVIAATRQVLDQARAASVPIIFTSFAHDPAHPACPHDDKLHLKLSAGDEKLFDLDPRLGRLPTEKLMRKRYASCFKGTGLHEMLTGLGIDTLIVTGASTSHCVYATCRDATDSFRVIVPREAVGERCELMHEVFLTDIDIDLADVLPLAEVLAYLRGLRS